MERGDGEHRFILRVLTYNTILSGQFVRVVNCMPCLSQSVSAQRVKNEALVDEHDFPVADVVAFQETGSEDGWKALVAQITPYYPNITPFNNSLLTASTKEVPMGVKEPFVSIPGHAPFYPFGMMITHFPQYRFSLMNIHPSAESYPWQQRAQDLAFIRSRLDKLRNIHKSHAIILAGDHNVNLYKPLEFTGMFRILGLERAIKNPFLNPSVPQRQRDYSFYGGGRTRWVPGRPSPIPYSSNPTRLDYIWVFSSVDGTVTAEYRDERIMFEATASDHKPVFAMFEFVVKS
jgi:hypothetical protein